jgi:hypothetical protein
MQASELLRFFRYICRKLPVFPALGNVSMLVPLTTGAFSWVTPPFGVFPLPKAIVNYNTLTMSLQNYCETALTEHLNHIRTDFYHNYLLLFR